MADESGVRLQKVVWEETRAVLLKVSPEAYDQVLPKAVAPNAVNTEKQGSAGEAEAEVAGGAPEESSTGVTA